MWRMTLWNRRIGFSAAPCVTLPSRFGECAHMSMKIAGRGPQGCRLSAQFRSAFAGSFLRGVPELTEPSLSVRSSRSKFLLEFALRSSDVQCGESYVNNRLECL